MAEYSRLVYSTDGGRSDTCLRCGRKHDRCVCTRARAAPPTSRRPPLPRDGVVRVFRERGGRGGKIVTLITGLPANALDDVATTLKKAVAAGGRVNGDVVELQGDHRDLVAGRLTELGYRVKLAGG
ncbi:MAG: stress response translation initiation inhibitor YciH [Chloroflexota bacterium]|nr:MAG: stress response translation initiation inhibitor YciH [Chloroflexota bacterium]